MKSMTNGEEFLKCIESSPEMFLFAHVTTRPPEESSAEEGGKVRSSRATQF